MKGDGAVKDPTKDIVSTWMPAGEPVERLTPVLRLLTQDLSGSSEAGAGPRVAILLDSVQPRLVNCLAMATKTRDVLVCSRGDRAVTVQPEYAGLVDGVRVMTFENQIDLHRLLATYGRFDVVVDGLNHSSRLRVLVNHLFIGAVRDGGCYVSLDGTVLGRASDTAELITRASRSLAGLHGGVERLAGDERSYGEQISSMTVLDGGVLQRKRGDGFIKLRYDETLPILDARYGQSWGRRLETTPARVMRLNVVSTTNNPELCAKKLHRDNRLPEIPVMEYSDVSVAPRQVVVKDHLLLPNTFRLATTKRLVNTALTDLNHYHAAPSVETQDAPRLEGVFFHLDLEYNRHFGHFMTEAVPRLYAWELARAIHPDIRVITSSSADRGRPAAYQRTLLEAYGIPNEQVEVITSPVKVDTLVCAMPLMQNGRFADPRLAETCHRLRDGLLAMSEPNETPRRRLFVSRKPGMWRECLNHDELEERFIDRGFTVIQPEGYSIVEQARMFSEADVVAGYIGSALYNIMFTRKSIDLIGFINESYVATNEYLICSALGHRMHLFFGDEVVDGRDKDCEGRELGVTNRDYVFNVKRDGARLDTLLDSLEERWGQE